jgi:hypothetical protein
MRRGSQDDTQSQPSIARAAAARGGTGPGMSSSLRGRRQAPPSYSTGLMRPEARSLLGASRRGGGGGSYTAFLAGTLANVMLR